MTNENSYYVNSLFKFKNKIWLNKHNQSNHRAFRLLFVYIELPINIWCMDSLMEIVYKTYSTSVGRYDSSTLFQSAFISLQLSFTLFYNHAPPKKPWPRRGRWASWIMNSRTIHTTSTTSHSSKTPSQP